MSTTTRRLAATAVIALTATTSLAACGRSSGANADADAHPKMTIMVGGIDKVIYLPAKLTEQLGYFKDSGVDVSLKDEPSGADAETMMLAGQVDAVVGFYDHAVTLQTKGKCVESVVQFAKVPGEAEVVRNGAGISSTADFKGKKLGVTSPGSSTDYLTQYLAKKAGVPTDKYTTVAAGAGSDFIAALQHKGIDAGMTTDPTIAVMEKQHLGTILADMRTEEGTQKALGGNYPAASLYMDCAYAEKNPKTVQKVVNAFVKTLAWITSHSAADVAAKMPKEYNGGDAALYEKAIDGSKGIFTSDGVMPSDGPQTVFNVLSTSNPDVIAHKDDIDLSKTFTTKFVEAAK
ncbi:ABC transporter substrate-binding protein [Nocardioides phosphati]|nr:ABC transporter substrate-binding protein [Nocardioides phosphati]